MEVGGVDTWSLELHASVGRESEHSSAPKQSLLLRFSIQSYNASEAELPTFAA